MHADIYTLIFVSASKNRVMSVGLESVLTATEAEVIEIFLHVGLSSRLA